MALIVKEVATLFRLRTDTYHFPARSGGLLDVVITMVSCEVGPSERKSVSASRSSIVDPLTLDPYLTYKSRSPLPLVTVTVNDTAFAGMSMYRSDPYCMPGSEVL